jgi:hypothetical protein
MNIDIYKSQIDTNDNILIELLELIKNGGAVPNLTSKRLLYNCQAIYFIKDKMEIASTGALKFDRLNYRNEVFRKAGLENENVNFLELGYIATSNNHLRKGYANAICQRIIKDFPLNNIFATTRVDNIGMLKILNDLDFHIRGNSYPSTNGDYRINLLTKTIKNV